MKKLRVIQIGLGHDHAPATFDTLLQLNDVFELAALAFPGYDKGKYEERKAIYDAVPIMTIEEALALPDIDAAVIEAYDMDLVKYAQMAADRGLHVQMDKPGNQSIADFEKLVNTCKEKNLVFHMGYMYRYNPAVTEAIEKATSGELGEIFSVEAHMDCLHTAEKRNWLKPFKGGMLFFLGCHLIDLIYRIQGEPDEILPLSCATGFDGVDAQDYGMVLYKYKRGISFAKTCATEVGGFMRRQLVICGSKGTMELKPLEQYNKDNTLLVTPVKEAYKRGWHTSPEKRIVGPTHRYESMLRAFASYVRGEKQNPYTYDYELGLFKLLAKSCDF